MSIERAMDRYIELMRSDIFLDYEKDFAHRITLALSSGYKQGLHEPPPVQIMEDLVNGVHGLTKRDDRLYFELSTRSIFIHGNKSQVEFDFYGQERQRELCDLMFIVSVVWNRRKSFEKITLSQFKKDKTRYRKISWGLDNVEQLYLLSRFPLFRGARGSLISTREHSLPNYSGCLGSYGLLYKPGDFAFVSATRLSSFMGDRKTLRMMELHELADDHVNHIFGWTPIVIPPFWVIFGNCHYCHDTFSFVDEYLKMNMGEPVFMKVGLNNRQARNLVYELMNAIKNKAEKEGIKRMLDFVNSFDRFPYEGEERQDRPDEHQEYDPEAGGIGIIHTTIDLGE